MLLPILMLSGCNFSSSAPASGVQEIAHVPLEAPPGAREDSESESFPRLLTRANALELNRRPIEALRLYRRALEVAPSDLTMEARQQVKERISRLSFVLGIPDGADLDAGPTARKVEGGESTQMLRAMAFYKNAQEAELAGRRQEALALYREVLKQIRESDGRDLYWNAWQKIEDLSPEGEGPAAVQQRRDETSGDTGEESAAMVEDEDGTLVRGGTEAAEGGRPADASLSRARSIYMKGMDYNRANNKDLARQSFSEVLTLIRESQDPELYRAARQNLVDIQGQQGP